MFFSEYSSESINFTDDTTTYECGKSYDEVVKKFKSIREKTIWAIGLTIITKHSIFDVAAALDPPLSNLSFNNHVTDLCC